MEFKTDYHIHSFYSDGVLSPTEIVKRFRALDYDIISITDHDGFEGLREVRDAVKDLEMEVVPGIEFSTLYDFDGEKLELHILGYNFDTEDKNMIRTCEELKENRKERNSKLIAKLKAEGIDISLEDLPKKPGGYIGKPDIARVLTSKGYGNLDLYKMLSGVSKKMLSSSEAIELLIGAKGTAVLAHPLEIDEFISEGKYNFDKLVKLLIELKKLGLKGLECFHPSATEEDSEKLIEIAAKYHLHITSGSDFHHE